MPFILIQDTGRYLFLASGRPSLALASDAMWAVILLGALAGLRLAGVPLGAAEVLDVWLGAGAASAVFPLWRWGLHVTWSRAQQLARRSAEVSLRFLVGVWRSQWRCSTYPAADGSCGRRGGLGRVSCRVQVFGPINTLAASSAIAVLPELRKLVTQGHVKRAVGASFLLGLILSAASALWLGFLLTPRGHSVIQLFGATAIGLRYVIPLLGARYIFTCLVAGALTALRSTGRVRRSTPIVVASSVLQIVTGVVLGEIDGLHGILVALAVTEAATAVALWIAALLPGSQDLFSPPRTLEHDDRRPLYSDL